MDNSDERRYQLECLLAHGLMTQEENLEIPKVLNCPNCGAPITGDKCEYCGTVFKQQPKPEKKQIIADGVIYYDYEPGNTCKLYADNKCIMEIRKEDLL